MARSPLIVGNWKMFKTASQAVAFCTELRERVLPAGVGVVVCPPFTSIPAAHAILRGSTVAIGAQNMHAGDEGPFTGEISAPMLREFDVTYALLGHSERRREANETDETIAWKIPAALGAGITPVVIVGESLEEHQAGDTVDVVVRQLRTAFLGVGPSEASRCVVAYEPVWAIGSGLSDEPAQSDAVMAELRGAVDGLGDVPMLYGGSMKPANAQALMEQPNIDGGLVGGASLHVDSFLAIVDTAARCKHEHLKAAPNPHV
jgi:triosephosphate isomerase